MEMFSGTNSAWARGEKALISRICSAFGDGIVPKAPFGSGDDCALMKKSAFKDNVYATSDAVILDRHFTRETPPHLVGEKLVKRNVSDVASMGAVPVYAILSAVCSKNLSATWLDEFCKGVGESAQKYSIKIIGGDVASVPYEFFSAYIALIGHSESIPLLRSGAMAGDKLFVTGALGLSFESGHHLSFEPRIGEGLFFSANALGAAGCGGAGVSACTDLSDGIASDLKNFLNDKICALLKTEKIPCRKFGSQTADIRQALCGGEDYELLIAYRADSSNFEIEYERKFGRKLFCIGEILDSDCALKKYPFQTSQLGGKILLSDSGNLPEIFGEEGFSH